VRATTRKAARALLRPFGVPAVLRWLRAEREVARHRARNARYGAAGPDGLPLPPPRLILQVTGTPDVEWFLTSGAAAMVSLGDALRAQGVEVSGLRSVLDFGCGCGRVVRHWAGVSPGVRGCDYNPRLVDWCGRNLAFARFETNGLVPPLPFEPDAFDLVYALSVFTHLPADLQGPWMRELGRVLVPGGHLALSVHGRRYLPELAAEERARFERGELVVRESRQAGTNRCGAYHPERYVREVLAAGMELLALIPEGAKGNPHQDLVLLRKPRRAAGP
jgi:SAM-dependent methyltransferase